MTPPETGTSRSLAGAIAVSVCLSFSACATLHVPVGPPDTARLRVSLAGDDRSSINAWPLVDPASYADAFDDHLPALGIAAVWVEASVGGEGGAPSAPIRWVLKTPSGKKSALSPRDVLARYYKRRDIRMYSVKTDSEAEKRLDAIALPLQRLPGGGPVKGYLFFPIDPPGTAAWTVGSSLVVTAGGRAPVELRLPDAGH